MIYNAEYVEMIGDKHPAALGAPLRDVFPEIWAEIEPMATGCSPAARRPGSKR